jgi:hypothetical protein
MYFEVLIRTSYEYHKHDSYFIVKAENIEEAREKARKFASTYFLDLEGSLIVDNQNIAYEFLDGEVVEIIHILETTAEKFLEERIGGIYVIKEKE